MFNYKADHQFHLQSFSGFLLTFFSTQRGKMGGEKFKQKKNMHLLFSLLQICLITSWQHKSVVLVGAHTQYPPHPESCFLGKRNSANLYSFSFHMFGLNQSIETFGTQQYNWETHSVSSITKIGSSKHIIIDSLELQTVFASSPIQPPAEMKCSQSPWPSLPANLIC
jgi:hypothetical protein